MTNWTNNRKTGLKRQLEMATQLNQQGRFQEAISNLDPILNDSAARHEAIWLAARALRDTGKLQQAFRLSSEIINSETVTDSKLRAKAEHNIATILFKQGRYDDAIKYLEMTCEECPKFRPNCLHECAGIRARQGHFGEAERLIYEAIEENKTSDNQTGIRRNIRALALISGLSGHTDHGLRLLKEIDQPQGKLCEVAYTNTYTGILLFYGADYDLAKIHLYKAIESLNSMKALAIVVHPYRVLGECCLEMLEFDEARNAARTGFRIANDVGEKFELGMCHYVLGKVAEHSGIEQRATMNINQSYQILTGLGARSELSRLFVDYKYRNKDN